MSEKAVKEYGCDYCSARVTGELPKRWWLVVYVGMSDNRHACDMCAFNIFFLSRRLGLRLVIDRERRVMEINPAQMVSAAEILAHTKPGYIDDESWNSAWDDFREGGDQ